MFIITFIIQETTIDHIVLRLVTILTLFLLAGSAVLAQSGVSTTFDQSKELTREIRVFPNPTVDRFTIDKDQDVATVAVFNILGAEMFTKRHTAGTSYEVSHLRRGVYLVRLLNVEGEMVKSIRLSKQ